MKKNLLEKIKESLGSVLPVAAIVFLLMISIVPVSGEMFFMFFVGTVLLVVGIGLFTLGADTSMIIIGEEIGAKLVRLKKVWLILPICFIIGVLVTVAEPDLKVLADQTPIADSQVMIWSVGIGVGLFLAIAFLRIFLQIKISYLFVIFYALVFQIFDHLLVYIRDLSGIVFDPIPMRSRNQQSGQANYFSRAVRR